MFSNCSGCVGVVDGHVLARYETSVQDFLFPKQSAGSIHYITMKRTKHLKVKCSDSCCILCFMCLLLCYVVCCPTIIFYSNCGRRGGIYTTRTDKWDLLRW